MAIAGRISVVLGTGSLLLAGFLLFGMWQDHHSGAWFANLFDHLILTISPILAALGICGLLYGRHLVREARDLREFAEALKSINRPEKSE
jgi:hypothetical protein